MNTLENLYDRWEAKAKNNKWKVPSVRPESGSPMYGWVSYWRSMSEYETMGASGAHNIGRPVIPHR